MQLYTAYAAAPLALVILALGLEISRRRIWKKSKEPSFERWQRAHGNAAEHVPLVIVLLFLCEQAGVDTSLVLGVGLGFVGARVLHALGCVLPQKRLKFAGATGTYLAEAILPVLLLAQL
jgi:uncharacterized protein